MDSPKRHPGVPAYATMRQMAKNSPRAPLLKSYREKNLSWVTIAQFDSRSFASDRFRSKRMSQVHAYFLIYKEYGLGKFKAKLNEPPAVLSRNHLALGQD
jgi:hypothetical protein